MSAPRLNTRERLDMNRDDLRKVAAELNITGRSKMTKDELSDAIFEHPNNPLTVNRHGDVTDPRDTTPLPTTPDGGTVVQDSINYAGVEFPSDERLFATLSVGYGGNPDEFPSVESQHRMIDLAVMGNKRERHAARMSKTKTSAVNKFTERRIIRAVRAVQSRTYSMATGRGMGAKHYAAIRGIEYARYGATDATKPLAYGDRVRHYAKQNGALPRTADTFDGALLTHTQWRRAQHKQNKNRAYGTKAERYPAVA